MAGPTLGTAYVQIVPSAEGIKGSISRALGGDEEVGKLAKHLEVDGVTPADKMIDALTELMSSTNELKNS